MNKLPREFYDRETSLVAQELLGHYLTYRKEGIEMVGRIVEVEAYLGSHDLACHSSKGLTQRTATMFGPAGHAYIYLIYGMYHCFNVVTERKGIGAAVLIRAIEPIANISARTNGPGLLCKAMDLDRQLNGHDLLSDTLCIMHSGSEPSASETIVQAPRIGVDYAKDWAEKPLRFYLQGNPFVSKIVKT
jgi:DNA-3-methyladenine glycosylase